MKSALDVRDQLKTIYKIICVHEERDSGLQEEGVIYVRTVWHYSSSYDLMKQVFFIIKLYALIK
jgi:hypothetical protein